MILIQGAVSHDSKLRNINHELNQFMEQGSFSKEVDLEESIKETAACLSKELLYMKFLQGVPVVGTVGGTYDIIYMKQVNKYAELKYRRRFFMQKKERNVI